MRHERLKRRGADTNQNIFYLVIAVVLIAAASFAFLEVMKASKRAEISSRVSAMSFRMREVLTDAQGRMTEASALRNALNLPLWSGNRTQIVISGDTTAIARPHASDAGKRFPRITYTINWNSQKMLDRSVCRALASGRGPLVNSGPLGSNYVVTASTCEAVNPRVNVEYRWD